MICDGCVISSGALVEQSVLAPGVHVESGAVIRQSIILTGSRIASGAVIDHAIIDKRVHIDRNAQVGSIQPEGEAVITMIGKNSYIPAGIVIEGGAMIGPDVISSDFISSIVRGNDYIQTRRLPYEI
jgi:glucose-1-phosphate adenylyltransferase